MCASAVMCRFAVPADCSAAPHQSRQPLLDPLERRWVRRQTLKLTNLVAQLGDPLTSAYPRAESP